MYIRIIAISNIHTTMYYKEKEREREDKRGVQLLLLAEFCTETPTQKKKKKFKQ